MRRTGAIVFLGILFLCLAKIGSFTQALTIFTIIMWSIAACLFGYLVLYRGVRFNPFQRTVPADEPEYAEAEAQGGEVVPFQAPVANDERVGG
jgi:hypothetical protein